MITESRDKSRPPGPPTPNFRVSPTLGAWYGEVYIGTAVLVAGTGQYIRGAQERKSGWYIAVCAARSSGNFS
jgi:hypothetical protein